MPINNPYASAFSDSRVNNFRSADDAKRHDIIIGGMNYGKKWNDHDQAMYDLYLKSLEFESQMDLMEYQNEYNSPAQQAARLRAAGINPDFQNLTGNPSSGAVPSAPTAPSGEPRDAAAHRAIGSAQQFLQLIPQAIQMYTSMKSSLNQITMQDLQIDKIIAGLAYDDLLSDYNSDDFFDGSLSKTIEKEGSIGRSAVFRRHAFFDSLPKRQSKRAYLSYQRELNNLVSNNVNKLRSGVYGRGFDASSARSQYLGLLGQHGFNMNDDDFVKILRDFNEIIFEADKQESQNRKTRASAKPGLRLIEQGQKHVNAGREFVGIIEMILGNLLESGLSFSRTSGPKGASTSFGF